MTLSMGALAMQLGSYLLEYMHPRLQLLLGGSIFVFSILASSFMTDFYSFLVFYAVLTGLGYGLIYMLPLKSAWSFFPEKKGTIGGLILASHSFGAIGWSFFTAKLINPQNETPSLQINVGSSFELLYSPTSAPVQNVSFMLRTVFFVELAIFLVAVICMNKKRVVVVHEEDLAKGLLAHDHQPKLQLKSTDSFFSKPFTSTTLSQKNGYLGDDGSSSYG